MGTYSLFGYEDMERGHLPHLAFHYKLKGWWDLGQSKW